MDSVSGMIVLITGAVRGMGRLYAERANAEGAAKVGLLDVDVDAEALEVTAAEFTSAASNATAGIAFPFAVDLSSREDIAAAAERVRGEMPVGSSQSACASWPPNSASRRCRSTTT